MNSQKTVFVVDDEGCVRAALAHLLASAGVLARTFENLDDIDEALRADCPSCVLIDVFGSSASEEAVLRVQAQCPAAVILLITGCVFEPPPWCHAWKVLRKPIDDDELFEAVLRSGA